MKERKFEYLYNEEDDILSIYDKKNKPKEFIEVSDFLSLGIDKNNNFSCLEIADASNFFKAINEGINKKFLKNLQIAKLKESIYRGVFILGVILKSEGREIEQSLPPILRNEYKSPILQFAYN